MLPRMNFGLERIFAMETHLGPQPFHGGDLGGRGGLRHEHGALDVEFDCRKATAAP